MIASLLSLTLGGLAAAPVALPDGSADLQVRAARVLRADGSTLANGVLLVRDGKVVRLGTQVDPALPLLEHDGVLTAGLVACQTLSGMGTEADDDTRSLLPDARLVHAFKPSHSDFEKALAAGITTVVLTPTGRNIAGGLTAVVKTTGAVVEPEAHLALSFAESALGIARFNFQFVFSAEAEDDGHGHGDVPVGVPANDPDPEELARLAAEVESGGLEETRTSQRGLRKPTSFPGLVAELSERLEAPSGVFGRVAQGTLPCFLEAWERHEVQRALAFAKEHELTGALYGAPLAGEPTLVEAFRESGLGCVVGPYRIGQHRRSLEGFARLAEAGVPLAFALDAPDHAAEGLRLSAALALSAGADPAAVWRALTGDAARIAAVADRVGSLAPGRDADFCLWSGDPRDLTSRLEAVYVEGRLVHDPEASQR